MGGSTREKLENILKGFEEEQIILQGGRQGSCHEDPACGSPAECKNYKASKIHTVGNRRARTTAELSIWMVLFQSSAFFHKFTFTPSLATDDC